MPGATKGKRRASDPTPPAWANFFIGGISVCLCLSLSLALSPSTARNVGSPEPAARRARAAPASVAQRGRQLALTTLRSADHHRRQIARRPAPSSSSSRCRGVAAGNCILFQDSRELRQRGSWVHGNEARLRGASYFLHHGRLERARFPVCQNREAFVLALRNVIADRPRDMQACMP